MEIINWNAYKRKDAQKILKKNGFVIDRYHGSHTIYINADGRHISINMENFNGIIFRRLVKENHLVL